MGTPIQNTVWSDDSSRSNPIHIPINEAPPSYAESCSPANIFALSPGNGSLSPIVTAVGGLTLEPVSPPPEYSALPQFPQVQHPGDVISQTGSPENGAHGSPVLICGNFDDMPEDHELRSPYNMGPETSDEESPEPAFRYPRYEFLPPVSQVVSPSAPPIDFPGDITAGAVACCPNPLSSSLSEHTQGPNGAAYIDNLPDIHLESVTTVQLPGDVISDCLFDDALDENGSPKHIFILTDRKVVKNLLTGQFLRKWPRSLTGCTSGEMCIDSERDLIVITSGTRLIRKTRLGEDPGFMYSGSLTVDRPGTISAITHSSKADHYIVVCAERGKVYIVKANNGEIVKSVKDKHEPVLSPVSVSCHSDAPHNLIAVSDHEAHNIKLFDIKGKIHMSLGSEGRGRHQLRSPRGICMDAQGRVVVCDHGNRRVVRLCPPVDASAWRWECVLTPEQLFEHHPCHVDISSDGHMLVSLETPGDGVLHTAALYKGYL